MVQGNMLTLDHYVLLPLHHSLYFHTTCHGTVIAINTKSTATPNLIPLMLRCGAVQSPQCRHLGEAGQSSCRGEPVCDH